MGLGATQTVLNKGRKKSEKNPSIRELLAIIQNLSSDLDQLKKERGKDSSRSQQDMHIPSDKDSGNIDVLKNIPEVFNYLCILHLVYFTEEICTSTCWRSYLTTKYLRDVDGNFIDVDRPTLYESLISPEEWETFKAKLNTIEFKVRIIY